MVLLEDLRERLEVERELGDDAAGGRDVRGVERGEAGVAAEDPEHADPLVRAERRPLAVDDLLGARDRGREADAVLGPVDVVVHRLGDGDERHAALVQHGEKRERVVAADGHQVVEAQVLDVVEHVA